MSDNIKVSVILPVYNVGMYLGKCLDSLINQTLNEIEIICINDGSTDNSLEILEKYAQNDPRIKIIDKENEGQGVARNIGIDMAQGKYIGFVDPDDWVSTQMFEKMFTQAENLNSDIVICNFIKYEEENNKILRPKYFEKITKPTKTTRIDVEEGKVDRQIVDDSLLVSPCYSVNRIYKTQLLKSNNIKFSQSKCYEDVMFVLKSHLATDNISYIPQPFYFYRIRSGSTLRNIKNLSTYSIHIFKELSEYLQEKNIFDKYYDNYKYFVMMNIIWKDEQFSRKEKQELFANLKNLLSKNDISLVKKKLLSKKMDHIFSLTNNPSNRRQKILTILGIKLKFKYLKGQFKQEEELIKKIKQNQKKYPKDSYLLFDCLHDDTVECIDAYSLFEYMLSIGKKAYYVLLKTSELYKKLEAQNKLQNIIVLENSSREYPADFLESIYEVLLRAKAIITSFGENSNTVNKFFKKNKFWQYIFIQHGQIFIPARSIESGYLYPQKFDKFIVSSQNETDILKQYGWQENQLIKCGLPRWDLLNQKINTSTTAKKILIMMTWRKHSVINFDDSLYKQNLLNLINNEELHKYLKQNNIELYFAPHHALLGNRGINFEINNQNIGIVNSLKISDYIKTCDLLLTDFSSVSFDFMFQNKPVIYYVLDKDDENINPTEKKGIDYFLNRKSIMPNIFDNEKDVIEKLKYYIQNNFTLEEQTKEKYAKFFYTKENIRQKLTEEIDKICK